MLARFLHAGSTRALLLAVCSVCLSPAVFGDTLVKVTAESKAESPAPPAAGDEPFTGTRPAVDIAILLDTSNSMDGLINQAKAQLWSIVDRFANAKKQGKTPVLRVALMEYGNTRLPVSEGYLRQVVPLTDDLDKLSEELFALKTSGGDEYCGQVIDEAITRLDWSNAPGSYQAIFIAGNEPFTQGPVDYRKACKRAIESGVVVNTIHCGSHAKGVSGQWAHGAQLAEGKSFNIDQDQQVETIETPHDEVIIRLSAELNGTYLWYGKHAQRYRDNQVRQDSNAWGFSKSAAASRAKAKASGSYSNLGRCLVDNYLADEESLEQVAEEDLPEVLRKMKPEARLAHVKQLARKRKELQAEIKALNAKRSQLIAEIRKQNAAADGKASLGDAFAEAIDQQLDARGYETE